MNITFSLCFGYILCFSLQMDLYFLCSILAIDIFIILFGLFCWITKCILHLHNRANILGMFLIMLCSNIEIHICHL
jgi:hypothetical protein